MTKLKAAATLAAGTTLGLPFMIGVHSIMLTQITHHPWLAAIIFASWVIAAMHLAMVLGKNRE